MDSMLATTGVPAARAQGVRLSRVSWAPVLILLGYALAAVGLTWRMWADPGHMAPTAFGGRPNMDVYLATWFMRYVATALAHGHVPALVTTAVNAPQGINAMWNTSLLGPAVVLTPVTLVAGPIASLALLTTVGFAGSAASMYFVLRRWEASVAAAALGGAFFAFMPALTVSAEDHFHLQFAVLIPLIVDAILRLVTGRGRPVTTGLWLGLLLAVQLFIAEELLVDTAVATAVIIVVLLLSRPRRAPRLLLTRLKPVLIGLGCAAGLALLICAPALWVQFHGPLAEHGSPWNVYQYGFPGSSFVTAPGAVLLRGEYTQYLYSAGLRPIETLNYLGWPLLAAMVAIPVVFWRDLRVRITGLSFLLLELMSMGGHSQKLAGGTTIAAVLLPWHWLQGLPMLDQLIVNRLSIPADGLAAVVLALVTDRVIAAVRRQEGRRQRVLAGAAIAALAAIVVPLIPRPVPASRVPGPPVGWAAVIKGLHLPNGAAVLVLPLNGSSGMLWQAETAEPISITGGYCIAPNPAGQATKCATPPILTSQQLTIANRTQWLATAPGEHAPSPATMATALRQWHPAAVIMTLSGYPRLTRFMLTFFGRPSAASGRVMGWRTSWHWYQQLGAYLRIVNARAATQRPRHHASRSIMVAFACPPPSHMACSP